MSKKLKNKINPVVYTSLLLVASIFIVEVVILIVSSNTAHFPMDRNEHIFFALLNGLITSLVLVPFVYFWSVKPLKKELAEVEKLTIIDSLTGIYNRRGFNMFAEQQMKYSIRMKQKLELFFIDIDNLKTINDKLGHKEGDVAIVATAEILRKSFRDSDIVSRLGGDEFLVLAIGKITEVSHITDRIESYSRIESPAFKLSVSVGVAEFDPENPCSVDDLIFRADKLMYEQKEQKKKAILTLMH